MVTPVITALIGLGGVILGALATLLSPALTDRRQARSEARRWRRDQLATAYEQALRYLLRAANRRSEFEGGRGGAVLNRQHQREWFDDMVEAQVWLRTVTRYCDPTQVDRIRQTADHLDKHVSRLVSGERFDQKSFSIWTVLQSCIATVTDCARIDRGNSVSVLSGPEADTPVVFASLGVQQIHMGGQQIHMGGDITEVAQERTSDPYPWTAFPEVSPGSIWLPDDQPRGEAQERS